MRLSTLVGKTLRQPPSEAQLASHQLLVRGAYVRGLEVGQFAYLPLGCRVLHRLEERVRSQLEELGAQEIGLAQSPEEDHSKALCRIVGHEIDSYRQLPVWLYEFQAQSGLLPKGRSGLFGSSESPSVEVHAFDGASMVSVEQQLDSALAGLLRMCSLKAVWVEAGDTARRIVFPNPSGDTEIARCSGCGHAAERSWAQAAWPEVPAGAELSPGEIETPGCNTIASLAEFLGISAEQTLKMVFYSVSGRVTCVVIRGDRAVDENKLARLLGTDRYYASLDEELAAIGAVGGYASPIGLDRNRVRVVADPSVRYGRNWVTGANRPGYHIQNVNIPRDFEPGEWADLASVEPGDSCPRCGSAFEIETAFALAYTTRPTPCQPDAQYLDAEGRAHVLWTASWRLDLGRLLAAVVESHHDEYGIIWPQACAPFDVHLVALDLKREDVVAQAEELYASLQAGGLQVLYDDRAASAGVKFNDADLLGVPLRLTVSKRSVQDGLVEVKWRNSGERLKLDEDGLAVELARFE